MKLTIHRGAHQIGGNCVEIATDSTRIILDVGLPLDDLATAKTAARRHPTDPLISNVFAQPQPVAGVLISHAHADHTGLLGLVPADVPVYLSEGTSKMMLAGSLYAGQIELKRERQQTLKPHVPKRIGDIMVTAYPVDHSAFDAQAFLVEADGKRVLYSGDMRLHGRKPGMAKALIKAVSDKSVDVLLMEGTHFSADREAGLTEEQLEQTVLADIQSAPGLVLACFSPMHIDRMVTFYKATRRTKRVLVLDHYGAYVLFLAATMTKVPKPEAEAGIRVFLPQRRKIIAKVERRFAHNHIAMDEIVADQCRYVMLFRSSMIATDFKGKLPERVRCLYSYWSGYLKRPDWQETQAKVAEAGGDFLGRHTSGHIFSEDIMSFVREIKPRHVTPVHTSHPKQFKKHFGNVVFIEDGEELVIK